MFFKFDIIIMYWYLKGELWHMSKSMIKIFSLIFAIMLLAASLAACKTPDELPEESSSETESDKVPETEGEEIDDLALVVDMICEYTIVRPEIMGDELEYEVMEVKKAIGNLTRETPKIAEDWLNPFTNQQPEELEIIIGNCNREETQSVLAGLKYNDWAVEIVGKKLVIAGHSEETTREAIAYFMQFLIGMDRGQDFYFLSVDRHTERADYEIDELTVNGASLSEYRVVIPALCSTAEKKAAEKLAAFLSDKTGYLLDVVKDNTEETGREILVGKTNRQASKSLLDSMRYHDSAMKADGEKLILLGYISENTVKVCERLEALVSAKSAKDTVAITEKDSFEDKHKYEAEEIVINGRNLRDYVIVYPIGDELCYTVANNLNKAIISKIGISLEVITDKASKKTDCEILIGNTDRTNAFDGDPKEGAITVTDKSISIVGGSSGGFGKAVGQFINRIFPEGKTGTINATLAPSETFMAETEAVKVMSYNILTWPTEERLEQIVTIIREYAPDVIGMQEAVPSALAALREILGDTYDCIYLERDEGTGESTPIWYNKNKYNLIESGSGWLSETPSTMSKLNSSEYYRVYVYAVLESKETGARFVHVNTHLDFASAQQQQVSILLAQTAHLSYMPMFYTADWNFVPGEMGYKLMHSAGYTDASVMTENVDGGATISGGSEIDFCFASIQNTSVDSYMVIDDHEFSETSSDHYPILIDLNITK